jgi:menaquinone-dependent protoporphyrinogen oxidase
MNVAVIYASKYESTREVADAIAAELERAGLTTQLRDANELGALPDADAFVIGSAVYAGQWLKPARELISAHADRLATKPVFLFSVGPVGDAEQQKKAPPDITVIAVQTAAKDHALFAGRLDPGRLRLAERLMVRAMKAPVGDYRDWDEIRMWSRQVAAELLGQDAKEPITTIQGADR